jgi:uncharacterized protein DUF1932
LLLASATAARQLGVDKALEAEWRLSQPELPARARSAAVSAAAEGWRSSGQMEQIALTFDDASMPAGFHLAAAEIFARIPRDQDSDRVPSLDDVLSTLLMYDGR